MPLTADQFVQSIVETGLLSADELSVLLAAVPEDERPHDGEALARPLIERDRLTEFQCQELLNGTCAPLILGDYVLLARIGAGGMAQVFRARHRWMKRLVAVKLLPAAHSGDLRPRSESMGRGPGTAQLHGANSQSAKCLVWFLEFKFHRLLLKPL